MMFHPSTLALVLLIGAVECGWKRDISPAKCSKYLKPRESFGQATVNSKEECSALCDKFQTCKAFAVQTKTRKCTKLKRVIGKDAEHLMPKKGWTYKEKQTSTSRPSKSCSLKPPKCQPTFDTWTDIEIVAERGNTWGFWGRDHARTEEEDPRYYWMDAYSNVKTLYWYENLGELWLDKYRNNFPTLPFGCDGMQNMIYDGKLWCRRYNDRQVNVFDFENWVMTAQISFDSVEGHVGGYGGQCNYDHGGYRSDIDVTSDETGVYIIWARQPQNCRLSISKIDLETYTIERTWHTQYHKPWAGNTFMICGRLYAIEHYNGDYNYLHYSYDTRTHNETYVTNTHETGYTFFPNEYGHLSFANYNPVDGYLYVYNNVRWGRKRPVFSNMPYEASYWRNFG